MILSRAPVRITLGGGGTDLKSYYSKHEGFMIGIVILGTKCLIDDARDK